MGRAPQHLLSRPSSFRSVEKGFHRDVMQIVNNVQINGWSCSPKHDAAHFTVLKQFFVWMVWSCSDIFTFMSGPCSPQTRPSSFHSVEELFLRCYAAVQKLPSLWLGRVPQCFLSRLSSFRSVEKSLCFDVMQTFNNVQMNGWSCSSKHGRALFSAALPNIPIHGPAHFVALKSLFVLCRLSTTFKSTAGRAPPNTVLLISRCWKHSSSGAY